MKRRYLFLIGLLLALFSVSVGLNYFLFNQSLQYYQDLNATRLDPLGLSYFTESQELGDGTIAVFFGDSRAESWPPPNMTEFEFINRGIGAQTTAQVSQRFDEHVLPLHPQVIVLQVGINDLKTIPLFLDKKKRSLSAAKTISLRSLASLLKPGQLSF